MRLALGMYLVLVLTRGAGERGYIAVGLYSELVLTKGAWVLCTGAHQGSQGTRLGMSLHSLLVVTRRDWEQG